MNVHLRRALPFTDRLVAGDEGCACPSSEHADGDVAPLLLLRKLPVRIPGHLLRENAQGQFLHDAHLARCHRGGVHFRAQGPSQEGHRGRCVSKGTPITSQTEMFITPYVSRHASPGQRYNQGISADNSLFTLQTFETFDTLTSETFDALTF